MFKRPTDKEIKQEYTKYTKKVTRDDFERVFDKQEEIEDKFKRGHLAKFANKCKLLFSLIKDYWNKDYRNIPWHTVAAVVATLLYVLSPVDLIPDFIPFLGYVDDAAVISLCLKLLDSDLERYETWKRNTDRKTDVF